MQRHERVRPHTEYKILCWLDICSGAIDSVARRTAGDSSAGHGGLGGQLLLPGVALHAAHLASREGALRRFTLALVLQG